MRTKGKILIFLFFVVAPLGAPRAKALPPVDSTKNHQTSKKTEVEISKNVVVIDKDISVIEGDHLVPLTDANAAPFKVEGQLGFLSESLIIMHKRPYAIVDHRPYVLHGPTGQVIDFDKMTLSYLSDEAMVIDGIPYLIDGKDLVRLDSKIKYLDYTRASFLSKNYMILDGNLYLINHKKGELQGTLEFAHPSFKILNANLDFLKFGIIVESGVVNLFDGNQILPVLDILKNPLVFTEPGTRFISKNLVIIDHTLYALSENRLYLLTDESGLPLRPSDKVTLLGAKTLIINGWLYTIRGHEFKKVKKTDGTFFTLRKKTISFVSENLLVSNGYLIKNEKGLATPLSWPDGTVVRLESSLYEFRRPKIRSPLTNNFHVCAVVF